MASTLWRLILIVILIDDTLASAEWLKSFLGVSSGPEAIEGISNDQIRRRASGYIHLAGQIFSLLTSPYVTGHIIKVVNSYFESIASTSEYLLQVRRNAVLSSSAAPSLPFCFIKSAEYGYLVPSDKTSSTGWRYRINIRLNLTQLHLELVASTPRGYPDIAFLIRNARFDGDIELFLPDDRHNDFSIAITRLVDFDFDIVASRTRLTPIRVMMEMEEKSMPPIRDTGPRRPTTWWWRCWAVLKSAARSWSTMEPRLILKSMKVARLLWWQTRGKAIVTGMILHLQIAKANFIRIVFAASNGKQNLFLTMMKIAQDTSDMIEMMSAKTKSQFVHPIQFTIDRLIDALTSRLYPAVPLQEPLRDDDIIGNIDEMEEATADEDPPKPGDDSAYLSAAELELNERVAAVHSTPIKFDFTSLKTPLDPTRPGYLFTGAGLSMDVLRRHNDHCEQWLEQVIDRWAFNEDLIPEWISLLLKDRFLSLTHIALDPSKRLKLSLWDTIDNDASFVVDLTYDVNTAIGANAAMTFATAVGTFDLLQATWASPKTKLTIHLESTDDAFIAIEFLEVPALHYLHVSKRVSTTLTALHWSAMKWFMTWGYPMHLSLKSVVPDATDWFIESYIAGNRRQSIAQRAAQMASTK